MSNPLNQIIEQNFFDLENKICLEIGVQKGIFSQQLYDCKPKHLYLIDCWEYQNSNIYKNDNSNISNEEHLILYNEVREKFKNKANVTIIKDYSLNALNFFDDNFFDFIYIDANHTYDAVYSDIISWWKKVKYNGWLCGHDINWRFDKDSKGPSVKRAVDKFCKENNLKWILLSRQSWGIQKTENKINHRKITEQYLQLAKKIDSPNKKILKTDIFNEYKNFPIKGGIANNLDAEVYCIDTDKEKVDICKNFLKHSDYGDIRKLQFENNFFDVVLDFSTIDHIQEYKLALNEYHRVLKEEGEIIVVFWGSNKERFDKKTLQYYFDTKIFLEEINLLFKKQQHFILYEDSWRTLNCFKGTKISEYPWKYLNDQNLFTRQILAAQFLQNYNIKRIVEIGGGLNPVSNFINYEIESYTIVDTKIYQNNIKQLNDKIKLVEKDFQNDLSLFTKNDAIVILGFDLYQFDILYEYTFKNKFIIIECAIDWPKGLKNITRIKKHLNEKNLIADICFDIKQVKDKNNLISINKPWLKRNMLIYNFL